MKMESASLVLPVCFERELEPDSDARGFRAVPHIVVGMHSLVVREGGKIQVSDQRDRIKIEPFRD